MKKKLARLAEYFAALAAEGRRVCGPFGLLPGGLVV